MTKEAIKSRKKRLKNRRLHEAKRELEDEETASRNDAYDTEDEKEAAQDAAQAGLPDPTADPMTSFYVDGKGRRRKKRHLHEQAYSNPGYFTFISTLTHSLTHSLTRDYFHSRYSHSQYSHCLVRRSNPCQAPTMLSFR